MNENSQPQYVRLDPKVLRNSLENIYSVNQGFDVLWLLMSKMIWAATWQNQQSECAPIEDSD